MDNNQIPAQPPVAPTNQPAAPVTPAAAAATPPQPAQTTPQATVLSASGGGKSNKTLFIIIGVVLFVLLLAGGGYYYWSTQMQNDVSAPVPVQRVKRPTATGSADLSTQLNALDATGSSTDVEAVDKDIQGL